jgi:hypothetical protein
VLHGDTVFVSGRLDWDMARTYTSGSYFNVSYTHISYQGSLDPVGGADVLHGGAGNDTMHGNAGHDVLFGGDSNDELTGDGRYIAVADQGDDFLDGGARNDRLFGFGGSDTLLGGERDDTYFVQRVDISVVTPQPEPPLLMCFVIQDSEDKNWNRLVSTLAAVRFVAEKPKAPANGDHWLVLA